jgi:hypothetical protein
MKFSTLSLYAALDTKSGRVHGNMRLSTGPELVAFLEEVVSLCPPRQETHIFLDNLSAHNPTGSRLSPPASPCPSLHAHLFFLA